MGEVYQKRALLRKRDLGYALEMGRWILIHYAK